MVDFNTNIEMFADSRQNYESVFQTDQTTLRRRVGHRSDIRAVSF